MATVKLYVWNGVDGLVSSSPYCFKAHCALQYKKISTEIVYVSSKFPKWVLRGKLPVAEVDGHPVEDSTYILRAIDHLPSPKPSLFPETTAKRAEALLFEDWIDEAFALNLIYHRWCVDGNFEKFSKQAFGGIPFPIRKLIVSAVRSSVLHSMKDRGIGHFTEQERIQHFCEGVGIIEQRLINHPFLIVDRPTSADFATYGVLKQITAGKIAPISRFVEQSSKIQSWMKKLEEAMKN